VIGFTSGGSRDIIAYDCAKTSPNYTTVALDDVEDCVNTKKEYNVAEKYGQIIQREKITEIEVLNCVVHHKRVLYRCSTWSDLQPINSGGIDEILDIPSSDCYTMYNHGTWKTSAGNVVDGLKPDIMNVITTHDIGKVDDGSCTGVTHISNGRNHRNVISYDTYRIEYRNTVATYDSATSLVAIKDHSYEVRKQKAYDTKYGNFYWLVPTSNTCDGEGLNILYEGNLLKFKLNNEREVIVVNSSDVAFGVEIESKSSLCGRDIEILSNKQIFVVLYDVPTSPTRFKGLSKSVVDLDITLNMVSRLIYLDRHFQSQLDRLASYLTITFCQVQKKILKRLLDMAYIIPERFVTELMKSKGYMIDIRGSVGYIHKCEEVIVELVDSNTCYQQIPVRYRNASYFINPDSYVLSDIGEEMSCTPLAPTLYRLDDNWFRSYPTLEFVRYTPKRLNPNQNISWDFESGSYNRRALYTDKQLEDYRTGLLYKNSLTAIKNNIGRGAIGYSLSTNRIDVSKLVGSDGYHELLNRMSRVLLGSIWSLGNITSNIFGLYIVYRCILMVAHWLSNTYILYRVHGFNIRLLGGVSSLFTKISTTEGDYKINIRDYLRRRKNRAEKGNTIQENDVEDQAKIDIEKPTTTKSSLYGPLPSSRVI